jgi:hypothetical protein
MIPKFTENNLFHGREAHSNYELSPRNYKKRREITNFPPELRNSKPFAPKFERFRAKIMAGYHGAGIEASTNLFIYLKRFLKQARDPLPRTPR